MEYFVLFHIRHTNKNNLKVKGGGFEHTSTHVGAEDHKLQLTLNSCLLMIVCMLYEIYE